MNKQDITRGLIELAVDQTMKDMKINSHRSIRRMADLGRQFAKGRFQDHIFSLFQTLLTKDNSPYYDMFDHLLSHADHAAIKHCGVNIGYNSWTLGASLIRKSYEETGRSIPWLKPLVWNPSSDAGTAIDDIAALVENGQKLGIFSYHICVQDDPAGSLELFELFSRFKDCAFLLDLSSHVPSLTEEQLMAIQKSRNLIVMLPAGIPQSRTLADKLLEQKSLFAISYTYQGAEADALLEDVQVEDLLSYGSVFLILKADKGCSAETVKKVGDQVLAARLEQKYPAILIEWDSDVKRVDQIISSCA